MPPVLSSKDRLIKEPKDFTCCQEVGLSLQDLLQYHYQLVNGVDGHKWTCVWITIYVYHYQLVNGVDGHQWTCVWITIYVYHYQLVNGVDGHKWTCVWITIYMKSLLIVKF